MLIVSVDEQGATQLGSSTKSGGLTNTQLFPVEQASAQVIRVRPLFNLSMPSELIIEHEQSGGGFSDVFGAPAYQQKALANYYANYAPPYSSAQYNNSRVVRSALRSFPPATRC